MGKRTSQGNPPTEPHVRKKRRTLLGTTVRAVAAVVAVLLVLFLIGGWYYSGRIESGALEPPTSEAPDLEWTVTNSGSSVTLQAPSGTSQAGEHGLSGLMSENAYAQSDELVSSIEESGTVTDVRSIQADSQAPPADSKVNVDAYYYRGDPMTALGIEFEDIFYASDIGSFPAWYIEGTTDTWAIVVHGKGATLEEGLRVIPMFQDLGYHVMVISYRNDVGEARDPSGYHQYGATEWIDLSAAVRYAHENGASDHVLFGYSLGGSVVTSYLTQSPLRNFTKAAILDSPALSFEATIEYRAENTELPQLPFSVPNIVTTFAKWISSWRFDVDWDATNYLSEENLANLHAPMLIFHGTEDQSVPYSTSAEMAAQRPDITTLVTTDAGHTRSWNVGPDSYEETVRTFLAGLD